jgi:TetR/AcrR family transcriptional repressor of nem operon
MASAQPERNTRERIQDVAQTLILRHGYTGTSIDQIVELVGITKGAFFYHFKSKADLARALIERYARTDVAILEDNLARAEKLSQDPRQQLLIFVGLLIELTESTEEGSGCLFASYCYESGQFDDEIHPIVTRAILTWRAAIGAKLEAALATRSARSPVDVDSLADLLTVILEGAYIMARVFKHPATLAEQLRHYRTYLDLLLPG